MYEIWIRNGAWAYWIFGLINNPLKYKRLFHDGISVCFFLNNRNILLNFRNLVLFKNSKSLHTDQHSASSELQMLGLHDCHFSPCVTQHRKPKSWCSPTPSELLRLLCDQLPSRGQGSGVGYLRRPAAVCEHILQCGK